MTTPTPQRRTVRRADRYKQDSGVSPSTELMERTAPPVLQTPPVIPAPAPQLERNGFASPSPRPRRTQAAQMQPNEAPPAAQPQERQRPLQQAATQQVPPALQRVRQRPVQPVAPQQVPPAQPVQPSAKPEVQKMPKWLFLTLIGCMFAILTLITADSLMNAYLTTRQQEREAAYQRVLNNHPLEYRQLIEQYADENNLHPAFVAAIILNESSFRTGATSSVGARGLMQMMPDTAEWIAGKLDDDEYHFDDMYTAEKNIRYGTWYLGYLAKLFRGDAILMAAAYHAGQGEVIGWLSDPSMSKDGVTIKLENMIGGNTKTYVGRVTQAYAIYKAIYYPDAETVPASDGTAAGSGILLPDNS